MSRQNNQITNLKEKKNVNVQAVSIQLTIVTNELGLETNST